VSPSNILFTSGVLGSDSIVLELGCGVSGLIGLVLAPKIREYVLTDQEYVMKILRRNITENIQAGPSKTIRNSGSRGSKNDRPKGNIAIKSLDWESDSLSRLYIDLGLTEEGDHMDLLISCDCIYNEALIHPLVETQVSICQMAPQLTPTLCIVTQQIRSPDVFESWLNTFHSHFRVWRVPDKFMSPGLGEDSGFIVHIGLLRKELDVSQ
jgi:hypothetical protein